ncbi:MetQ/NlpA family ABC transporter substrate-binding protein [Oribacterium sp. WCC10]|uniref:MetQ/NlpA family ABC transporter substrate-binding protein n=1 Tax=Oribacterium sp. WCC10 TaxID=1855343 RepID=UPI0008E660E3|nr:MetQ/NlpA family ABC transporter substrate-binding protein [Oribacterium sp. WCC10]SFG25998.1 D-methionine transport system substrate-binding protein [Oribacterium sp. WCC10]
MKKNLAVTLAALLAAASLAGCGSSSSATAATEAAKTEAAAETTAAAEETKAEETKAADEKKETADGDITPLEEPVDIKIGATPSPHAEILEAAKDALKAAGINIEVVVYNDYVQPNLAVDQGELQANYFQHQPYLDDFNAENNTHVTSVGVVHYEPFGIYAGKSNDLANIDDGAQIAVPNDTTNEARALQLLQAQGVITLKDGVGLTATKQDIVENPHKVEILEVEAAQIPRSIESVDFACMNGNYAIDAGFKPSDALAQEDASSEAAQTYANIVAVSEADADSEWAKKLVEVLQSQEITDYINNTYEGGVIPIK